MEGKAATFGVEPFWWYFTELPVAFFPPLSIFLLIMAGIGIYRNPTHVFSWCLVPFVLAHSLVAHKEVRFLFPMALPFFYFATAGWQHFSAGKTFSPGWTRAFRFFWAVNLILLVFRILVPAKEMVAYSRFIWCWGQAHPNSCVYFVKEMPRKNFPLNMPFYLNPRQNQLSWYTDPLYRNDTTALKQGDLFFFTEIYHPKPQAPPGFQFKKRYNYYPEWLLMNNTNNWQSRTRIWEVYEILPADGY
jgi:phosphatidylinositol glycan class B